VELPIGCWRNVSAEARRAHHNEGHNSAVATGGTQEVTAILRCCVMLSPGVPGGSGVATAVYSIRAAACCSGQIGLVSSAGAERVGSVLDGRGCRSGHYSFCSLCRPTASCEGSNAGAQLLPVSRDG
jgi:hypothetical protein